MTETARDAKLVQYLSEAYGKEKELETALQAHIEIATPRKAYKKRLQDHLKETKRHAREVERRIKKLGGGPSLAAQAAGPVAQVAGRVKAAAEGPIDLVRGGTGVNEQMLKNAQKEYWNEHDEIAKYSAIETLAEAVGDKETAQLARSIKREEERMAKFLSGQINSLTKAVVTEEIPASERRKSSSSRRRSSSGASRSASSRSSSSSGTRKRSSSKSSNGGRKRAASSSSSKSSASRSRSSSSKSSSTRAKSSSSKRGSSRGKSSSSTRKRSASTRKRSS